jgi:hypothetical protein
MEEVLLRLLSCVQADAGGTSDRIRERRRRLIHYWYASRAHLYRDEARPLAPEWYAEVADLFVTYTEACERFFDGDGMAGAELGVAWEVLQTIRAVEQAMTGYDEAVSRGDHAAAADCIHRALGELFDWENNGRIRAYVYALTGEALTDGLVRVEKTRLLGALERCREQLSDDIDRVVE